jgi:hypothetical protein
MERIASLESPRKAKPTEVGPVPGLQHLPPRRFISKKKWDEQVGRCERKIRRSSHRGDKGSSSSRDDGQNAERGAGPSDITERDDAAIVFSCVTPIRRKSMLCVELRRRDDKEEERGVAGGGVESSNDHTVAAKEELKQGRRIVYVV